MAFLRTVSTRRLLALVVAAVAVAGVGTAIAVAATSGGPVPPREPLAQAVHGALSGPRVTGITARITFTNQLISSSNLGEVASPLLTGASGRLWLSTDHKMLRLELQGNNGDAQLVVNEQSFWVYDPSSNTIYQGQLPAGAPGATGAKTAKTETTKPDAIPSLANIQSEITSLGKSLNLSGATPGDVAGQPTYTVTVTPPHSGGLLGAAAIAFDAVHGLPLQFSVYATGSSSPVLQLTATDITYGPVDPSSFAVQKPAGAKIVTVSVPSGSAASANGTHGRGRGTRDAKAVTGAAAVASRVPFTLVAPSTLVGVPRRSVRLLDWGGSPAALVSYGANLGGIIVIEQKADPAATTSTGTASGRHSELALPTVSINGVTGTELDTALGTMIRFTRSGVAYTVLGSVPAVAAEAAARGL